MPVKWDIVVLTAGNLKQQKAFELQISAEHKQYFSDYHVVRDEPQGAKIGSGGATLNALSFLHNIYEEDLFEKRILMLHSGGYSQRLPHVAALGKLFMLMPTGKTLFEHKLQSYNSLVNILPFGVFIASADTLEYLDIKSVDFFSTAINSEAILLVGHESDVATALGHGVYVLNSGNQKLELVLQKPSLELLKLWVGEQAPITDSSYLLPANVMRLMVEARKLQGAALCELCAYGDFLRPLGQHPLLNYFVGDQNAELDKWQRIMQKIMKGQQVEVLNLGPNSFYHFGTNSELLAHFSPDSMFFRVFLEGALTSNIVCSRVGDVAKVSPQSFIEYSQLHGKNYNIPSNCILSAIKTSENGALHLLQPPCNSTLITLLLTESSKNPPKSVGNNYITIMFSQKDDLKRLSANLNWFGHSILNEIPSTLWNCPLFEVKSTSEESLEATLYACKNGFSTKELGQDKLSVQMAMERVDVDGMLQHRSGLRALGLGADGSVVAGIVEQTLAAGLLDEAGHKAGVHRTG